MDYTWTYPDYNQMKEEEEHMFVKRLWDGHHKAAAYM
jgi:hypothetical protein